MKFIKDDIDLVKKLYDLGKIDETQKEKELSKLNDEFKSSDSILSSS